MLTYRVVNSAKIEDFTILAAVAPYERVIVRREAPATKIDQSIRPPSLYNRKPAFRLPQCKIPNSVLKLARNYKPSMTQEQVFQQSRLRPLNVDNHRDYFSTALYLEEIQMEEDIRNYDMEGVELEKVGGLYELEVPGLAERRPSVLYGDRIYLRSDSDTAIEYEGFVHYVKEKSVLLKMGSKFESSYLKGRRFNVRFTFSHTVLWRAHNGLDLLQQAAQSDSWRDPNAGKKLFKDVGEVESSRFANLNEEQCRAIRNILLRTHGDFPFVIYGPPGTGKTMTLVEAIYQWAAKHKNERILVLAPSNSAADVLTYRLSRYFPPSKLFRMNAYTRAEHTFSHKDTILKYSIQDRGNFLLPETHRDFLKYQIVVSTCSSGSSAYWSIPPSLTLERFLLMRPATHMNLNCGRELRVTSPGGILYLNSLLLVIRSSWVLLFVPTLPPVCYLTGRTLSASLALVVFTVATPREDLTRDSLLNSFVTIDPTLTFWPCRTHYFTMVI